VAALLSLVAPRAGGRAARRGLISLAIASAIVNGPLKAVSRRRRPRRRLSTSAARRIRQPVTYSFPSGHTASAFAFASGAAFELPALTIPLGALATAVGYSRIHTRVHYPSDVAAGAAVGVATAVGTRRILSLPARLDELLEGQEDETSPLQFRDAVLVYNVHAGRAARGLQRARRALEARGIRIVQEFHVDQLERLRELLEDRRGNPLFVLAAGGDGTVGSVADVLANTNSVLGVVPLGTSNDFARSLGIRGHVDRAVALFREGKVSTIDLGRMETPDGTSIHFVHAATAGLNVSFAKLATQASLRKRLRRLTYAAAAAVAFRERRPFRCRLVIDGRPEEVELIHLSVINAPVFGGFLGLRVRNSSVDDRLLDVLAVETTPLRRVLAAAALQILFRVTREVSGIRSYHLGRLDVQTDQALDVALDGEIRGKLPATFVVAGEALSVVTPRDFEDVDDPQP
jgi:undecaprenyl-diphosphatase